MKLCINGEDIQVSEELKSISDLVHYFHLQDKIIIIEHNHEILEKAVHHQVPVNDGDKIEIVHFVGGG